MDIFARIGCLYQSPRPAGALLLEGAWPDGMSGENWSLDEAIDARHAWIDDAASRLATRCAAQATETPSAARCAFLNELKLRYYFVKLLRVVAYFDQQVQHRGNLRLFAARDRDEDYVLLMQAIARRHGLALDVELRLAGAAPGAPPCRSEPPPQAPVPSPAPSVGAVPLWRRAAGWLNHRLQRPARGWPHVLLCGNRNILNPVCGELLRREGRVTWLYEQFALGTWRLWRGTAVRQWICGAAAAAPKHIDHFGPEMLPPLVVRGVDLRPAVHRFLSGIQAAQGSRQARNLAAIESLLRRDRPDLMVFDEDATPLPRAAILAARRFGVRTAVLQHGAPRVKFGFAPLAADDILVWGQSSADQLRAWGVSHEHVHITGSPRHDILVEELRGSMASARQAVPRRRFCFGARRNSEKMAPPVEILFFATMPPDDARPDAVCLHLTTDTHQAMLRTALGAVRRLREQTPVRLTIQLHPRCADRRPFVRALAEFPDVNVRLVASGRLAERLSTADCVINCASSAGLEATLAGLPVIELLPRGALDVMPASQWGTFGTAASEDELLLLLKQALACSPRCAGAVPAETNQDRVFAGLKARATASAVDKLLMLAAETPRHRPAKRMPLAPYFATLRQGALP